MEIDKNLMIALLCGVVSMVLSSLMPCILKSSTNATLVEARKLFESHRQVIVVSSVIVVITAYLALSLFPLMDDGDDFDDVTIIDTNSGDNLFKRIISQVPSNQLIKTWRN
jgi:hypothetical protein